MGVFEGISLGILGLVIWVVSMSMDKGQITSYVQEQGGLVVSINWSPFGTGWFGERGERIYQVIYHDREGSRHLATCKTSMLSGVYWTEDRITYSRDKPVPSKSV